MVRLVILLMLSLSGSEGLVLGNTKYESQKGVTVERATFTKAEREYVKGIVHNLSFQRLTDQEIVQWLHDEKQIELDRSTVSKMRNQVESKAEKWYIELKKSTYKFVAIYKERIDSLFSYQKKLHEIVKERSEAYPEITIKAISELHEIELSIFNLFNTEPRLIIIAKMFQFISMVCTNATGTI